MLAEIRAGVNASASMKRGILLALVVLSGFSGCARTAPDPVVVVGFRAEPGLAVPGRVMTSPDGEEWTPPVAVGEDGEWLTEVTRHGDGFAAIGLSGGVYLGDATGTHWSREQVHDSWLDALKFLPGDGAIGFLAGADAWWRTADGGLSWEKHTPPGYYFEDFAFRDGLHGVGVEGYLVPARGVVWRTGDGGASWSEALEARAGLRTVAAPDPAGAELWTAGDAGTLYVSTDGGASWADAFRWEFEPAGPPDYTGLDFPDPEDGFLVGSHGVIRRYRAADGVPRADRWTRLPTGSTRYVFQGVFARDAENVWACGYLAGTSTGIVLRTRDGGAHWTEDARTPGIFWYGVSGAR